jgi:hypothetical protein
MITYQRHYLESSSSKLYDSSGEIRANEAKQAMKVINVEKLFIAPKRPLEMRNEGCPVMKQHKSTRG